MPDRPTKSLFYGDHPYYIKGKKLYYNYYNHEDHEKMASCIRDSMTRQKWVVSDDNVQPVRDMYFGCRRAIYGIGYSARDARKGSEVVFFSDNLTVPPLVGAVTLIEQAPRLL